VRNRIGHKWSFPKGHKETSDLTDLSCARRELMEEAGIEAPSNYQGIVKLRAASYFVFLMSDSPTNMLTKDKNEIDMVQWFSIKELPEPCNVDVSMFKKLIGMYRNINYTTAEKTMNYIISEYAMRKFDEMNKRLEAKPRTLNINLENKFVESKM
jgi:ADP-ribose pyrophosphatase YjhB (NUDIX family)